MPPNEHVPEVKQHATVFAVLLLSKICIWGPLALLLLLLLAPALSPRLASFWSQIAVYWRPKAQGLSLLKGRLAGIRNIPAIKTFFLASGEQAAFEKMSGHLFIALWVKTMKSHVYLQGDIWPSYPLQRQREAIPLIAISNVMLSLLI